MKWTLATTEVQILHQYWLAVRTIRHCEWTIPYSLVHPHMEKSKAKKFTLLFSASRNISAKCVNHTWSVHWSKCLWLRFNSLVGKRPNVFLVFEVVSVLFLTSIVVFEQCFNKKAGLTWPTHTHTHTHTRKSKHMKHICTESWGRWWWWEQYKNRHQ